jgi:hypothetical protein
MLDTQTRTRIGTKHCERLQSGISVICVAYILCLLDRCQGVHHTCLTKISNVYAVNCCESHFVSRPLRRVPLATCIKKEERSEGVKPIEIHRRMKVQYGDACLSLQQVYEWTRKFMNGICWVTLSSTLSGSDQAVTPEPTAAVEAIVKENRRVSEWNSCTSGYESWISTPFRPWCSAVP